MTLLLQVAQMGRIDAIDRHMLDSQWVAALSLAALSAPTRTKSQTLTFHRAARNSHACASRDSRLIVRGDRCITCAVSSTVRPPKNRSSTIRA
jgi:hypothetical protein